MLYNLVKANPHHGKYTTVACYPGVGTKDRVSLHKTVEHAIQYSGKWILVAFAIKGRFCLIKKIG